MPSSHALTGEERFWRVVLYGMSALVLFFLMVPILAIIPLSFNSGTFLTYPLDGLSLRWYHEFINSVQWTRALKNSFIIGLSSAALATVLGTMAALGLTRANFRGKGLVMAILLSPMIVPVVITAVGFYFFFAPLGLTASYTGLIMAHTALGTPFVVITVSATLQGFDVISRARRRQPRGKPGGHILPCHFAVDCAGRLLRHFVRLRHQLRRSGGGADGRRTRTAHAAARDVLRPAGKHQPDHYRGRHHHDFGLGGDAGIAGVAAPAQ